MTAMTAADYEAVRGLTPADYHALDRVSSSRVQLVARSWAHYDRAMAGLDHHDSAALAIGSAVHVHLLQPARIAELLAVAPCATRTAKAYREVVEQSPGRTVLLESEIETVDETVAAVMRHPLARKMLEQLDVAERAILWESGGVACKALLDALWWRSPDADDSRANWLHIFDLKTTRDASPANFAKSCANYGYIYQAAWYLRARAAEIGDTRPDAVIQAAREGRYRWIAVETAPPHVCEVYAPDVMDIARADSEIDGWLDRIRRRQPGDWSGYTADGGPTTISMPAWSWRGVAP